MIDPSDWQSSAEEFESMFRDLTRQVRMLRQAVEELREEVFAESPHRWKEPIDAEQAPAVTPPLRLKSMPLNPCDPEFGRKINAVDVAEEPAMPPERPRAVSLAEFVARFTSESPASQIGLNDWADGQAVSSGVVVTVDEELYEWFAEHFEPEYEHPEGAYVLAGDNGGLYVLWGHESEIFLRQLTTAEAEEFDDLMRIAAEKAAQKREQFQVSQSDQKQQGCLW